MFIWNEICQKVFDVSNIMVSAPSVLNYTSVWIYKKIALQRRIQYRSKFIAEVQLYKSDLCGSMKQDVTREITSESLVILWGVSAGLSPFPPSRYTFYWMYTWEQWTETNLPSLILNVTLWRYHSWIYCHLRQLLGSSCGVSCRPLSRGRESCDHHIARISTKQKMLSAKWNTIKHAEIMQVDSPSQDPCTQLTFPFFQCSRKCLCVSFPTTAGMYVL